MSTALDKVCLNKSKKNPNKTTQGDLHIAGDLIIRLQPLRGKTMKEVSV